MFCAKFKITTKNIFLWRGVGGGYVSMMYWKWVWRQQNVFLTKGKLVSRQWQEHVGKKLGMLTKQQLAGWPQIFTKVELCCQTSSFPAVLNRWLHIGLVKMQIMASYILFCWYEEGKCGRVQFILLQSGNFVISRPWIVNPGGQLARISLATEGNCTAKDQKWRPAQIKSAKMHQLKTINDWFSRNATPSKNH